MVDLKLFDKNLNDPGKAINRIDFIIAVSKLLIELGADIPKVSIDYSPYKDWDLVPKYQQKYLATYVYELGYGGDDKSLLNPYRKITRAEAAVILDRMVSWQQQRYSYNDVTSYNDVMLSFGVN